MNETFNCAILDTGCANNNVCGVKWLDNYLKNIGINMSDINSEPSNNTFRFGGGNVYNSDKYVFIPCVLGGKDIIIKTNVVECDIPLLLSKTAMKKAGMIFNMKNDTVEIFDKIVSLSYYFWTLLFAVK